MNRIEQIELLSSTVVDEEMKISLIFKSSLLSQKLDPRVSILIKNHLGNLKSILDYLARHIFETYCETSKSINVYFPILRKECTDEMIVNKIVGTFPSLRENNKLLFDYFVNIQSSKNSSYTCLLDLNDLCNYCKHNSLILQTRKDEIVNRLHFRDGRLFIWSDGLVNFKDGLNSFDILPGGIVSVDGLIIPIKDPDDYLWSVGWIVQKLTNYQMRSCPDLSNFELNSYTLESLIVGNFFFPSIRINANSTLESFRSKVFSIAEDLLPYLK